MKKLYPRTKRQLQIADSYFKNWVKITKSVRALLLSLKMARAFAVFGFLHNSLVLLLRTKEILDLSFDHCKWLRKDLMVIKLLSTKSTARTGEPETVLLKDVALIHILKLGKQHGEGAIFKGSGIGFRNLYRSAVAFYGINHMKPTPHGLRRGGATWHFSLFCCYDKTAAHGRWIQTRTAELYIDTAMAAGRENKISEQGQVRLTDSSRFFSRLLARAFPAKG